MSLLRYFLPFLIGLLTHLSNRVFEQMESGGTPVAWVRMARYVAGVLTLVPAWLALLKKDRHDRRVIEAYLSAAVLYGVGVAIGYVIDETRAARMPTPPETT